MIGAPLQIKPSLTNHDKHQKKHEIRTQMIRKTRKHEETKRSIKLYIYVIGRGK